jgi:two-component system, NtrC family, sensor kinase
MKKGSAILLLALLTFFSSRAQYLDNDSLKLLLERINSDAGRLKIYNTLFFNYLYNDPDTALIYGNKSLALANTMGSDRDKAEVYYNLGFYWYLIGDYPRALNLTQESLRLAKKSNSKLFETHALEIIGDIYESAGDISNATNYERRSFATMNANFSLDDVVRRNTKRFYLPSDTVSLWEGLVSLINVLIDNYQLDSAIHFLQVANNMSIMVRGKVLGLVEEYWGYMFRRKKMADSALYHFRLGAAMAARDNYTIDMMYSFDGMASAFKELGKPDSAIIYANKVLALGRKSNYLLAKNDVYQLLAEIYKRKGNADSTIKYYEMASQASDSLFSKRKVMEMEGIAFGEELKQKEIEDAQIQYRNSIRTYVLSGGFLALLILATILYRNNQQKQKAKAQIEKAYAELKATQAQLIQSEKMASLGELTAGIAHEIQNPLNFVTNFSEVNRELITEMKTELQKDNREEAITIADRLDENEQKIHHHGLRADAIVKGMLQHSREGRGQKETTDLNALVDEYLRLSYQGFRAKDQSFQAQVQTNFDPAMGKVDIVRQDIGRVLLNLYNNAFYAISATRRDGNHTNSMANGNPILHVSTKKMEDKILISVKDNGTGIPQSIIDKIFQPFFTTKPTGTGTGLGLSLSYDIIRAHGGEIKVETKEGEGSEFIIQLPIQA